MSRICDSAGHTLVDVLLVLFLIGILLSAAAPDVARAHRRYTALTEPSFRKATASFVVNSSLKPTPPS